MMRRFLLLIWFAALFIVCNAQFQNNLQFLTKSVNLIQSNLKRDDTKITGECSKQLQLYVNKLTESITAGKIYENNWAWQIFDSSGKINAGLLTGNSLDLGNMDECLAIDVVEEEVRIRGKYCYAGINIPIGVLDELYFNVKSNESLNKVATERPMVYSISICLPNACAPKELAEMLGIPEIGNDATCQMSDTIDGFDAADWSFIAFIIIIAIFVICSTSYDMYLQNSKTHPIHPITLAFSFYTNGKKIFHTSNNPEQLSSLNGLRVFSILWVLAGHRYNMGVISPNININDAFEWRWKPYTQYIQGAPVSVDTFFFMSGVVMAYSFVKSQSKPNARFNVFMFYLHRYLRLTPALAVAYFFFVTIIKQVSTGPMWPYAIEMEQEKCLGNWYSIFLYIQNFVKADNMCLGHTWYLSADMQIFLISPLILLPLVKYPKHCLTVLIGLIVISVIIPITIMYSYDMTMSSPDYLTKYYYMPHTRIAPWFVGILLGTLLVKYQNKKFNIPKWMNLGLWIMVLTMMFLIIYIGHYVNSSDNVFQAALYSGLHRMFWSLGLMWIVFACQKGYGGFVNWLLTIPLFQVVARLSYSMYIIHVLQLLISAFRKRTPQYWDDYEMLSQCFGDIIIITFVSLFWCLLFESPMVVIEKIIFAKPKESKITTPSQKQPEENDTTVTAS